MGKTNISYIYYQRPLFRTGENDPFMEESCLRLRFYLIGCPLKDFDEKGDIRDGIQEI